MSASDHLNEVQFHHLLQGRPKGGFNAITASRDGDVVGTMTWGPGSVNVGSLWVHPDHRRQGIATGMWERGREVEPELTHHSDRTDAGDAWAQSVTPDVPSRKFNTTQDDVERKGSFSARTLGERLAGGDRKFRAL